MLYCSILKSSALLKNEIVELWRDGAVIQLIPKPRSLIYKSLLLYFGMATLFLWAKPWLGDRVPEGVSLFFLQALVLGILIYLLKKGWRPCFKISPKAGFVFFGLVVLYLGALFLIDRVLQSPDSIRRATHFHSQSMAFLILQLGLAPILEELYFRDFMFRAMRQEFGKLVPAVLFSSLFFMLAHFQVHPGAFLLGLVSSLLFFYFRSVIPSMVFHFISNLSLYFIPSFFPNLFFEMKSWDAIRFFYG